ncbi:MAG: ferredoxin reductase family protein [Candidatus Nanopelagicales bacterium]
MSRSRGHILVMTTEENPVALAERQLTTPTTAEASTSMAPAAVVVGLIAGITGAFWVANGGLTQLSDPAGGWLMVGQLAGIVAALASLGGLLLVARPAWLERVVGLDSLWKWHRLAGMTTIVALLIHVVASTVGFAGGDVTALVSETIHLMGQSAWMVAAVVSAVLFLTVATTSYRRIRQAMTYETWLGIHIAGYLAVILGFGHQLTISSDFTATKGLAHWWWIGLFAVTAVAIVWSRVGGLLRAFTTGRGTITRISRAADDTVAVEVRVTGRRARTAVAGQFFGLRVLTRDLWWQSHPISLSARPHDGMLRFTIKVTGDGTRSMAAVQPGTRVALEGPYGTFTARRAEGRPVALFGGGVGLTVIRAVLADCTAAQTPVVVARVREISQIPHLAEIRELVSARKGRLIIVDGPRSRWPGRRPFSPDLLSRGVPDLTERDVFVCGPPALERELERSLAAAGVERRRLHVESFGV